MPHRVRQKWLSSYGTGHCRVAISCLKRTHVGANGEGQVHTGLGGRGLDRDPRDQLPSVGHATPCVLGHMFYFGS
jgi:hypothetical protein